MILITMLRFGLLVLSFLGLISALTARAGLRIEFAPAVMCAGISSVMFAAGILNIFLVGVYSIFLLGLVCLVLYGKKAFWKQQRNCVVILVWLAVLVYFAVLLKGTSFYSYDNFSHWATVVKLMLMKDRMPNFQDGLINFQSYPLGSSLFLYYVCKIINSSESCFILAQILLSASFLTALAALVKKDWLLAVLLPMLAVWSQVVCVSIYSLQVDIVMALAALSLFCMTVLSEDEKSRKTMIFFAIPLYIFLFQVKSSGIFLVLVCWACWLMKNRQADRRLLDSFALWNVLTPVCSLLLWKRHVGLVFVSGETTKHAMSYKNYSAIFEKKTPDVIRQIGLDVLQRTFSLDTSAFRYVLFATLLLLILLAYRAIMKKSIRRILLAVAGIWVIWVVYAVSVFGMYIFSMPLGEAVTLAAFDRYMCTIAVFILGIALVFVFRYWCANHLLWSALFLLLFLFPLLQVKKSLPTLFTKLDYERTDRFAFQELVKEYDVPSGKSYFIYRSKKDGGYMYYLARYEFWSNFVTLAAGEELEDYRDDIKNYDYLIIWDQDDIIQKYLVEEDLGDYVSDNRTAICLR